MSKILSTLIAGLFAVSAFAADAPKAPAANTKPAVEAAAPAAAPAAKKVTKHHKKAKAAAKAKTAEPSPAPTAK